MATLPDDVVKAGRKLLIKCLCCDRAHYCSVEWQLCAGRSTRLWYIAELGG